MINASRIKCYVARIYLSIFRVYFGFDKWHVTGNIYCRAYKYQVIDLANSINPTSVVEIGCGLGDLITKINAEERIGLDLDLNVIKAAVHLRGDKCKFVSGSFDDAIRYRADLLIMVNWIHDLAPSILANEIKKLSCRYKYLLVDAITSERAEYKFKHDFDFMMNMGELISRFDCEQSEGRSILLYKFHPIRMQ
jgi:SAM-dependent methyltransferase